LKKKLVEIKKNRKIQMKSRENTFNICIVGYTNSGKSTLMNLLSKANTIEEDKLFSTLDTKTRKLYIDGISMTITDTVGFIEDLPHELIESFYSTLEVIKKADLLLHVIDLSSKFFKEKIDIVNNTIEQILKSDNLPKPKMLYVFNKVDLVENIEIIEEVENLYLGSVIISAKRKINIDKLKEILKTLSLEFYERQKVKEYSK
ncbi:MAG: GTPase, partial [Brevinematia bacterium]